MSIVLTGHKGPVGAALTLAFEQAGRRAGRIDAAALITRALASAALDTISLTSGPITAVVHAHVPEDALQSGPLAAMSDDECLARLAQAVEAHDSEHLDEVARLIGRLAVTIE